MIHKNPSSVLAQDAFGHLLLSPAKKRISPCVTTLKLDFDADMFVIQFGRGVPLTGVLTNAVLLQLSQLNSGACYCPDPVTNRSSLLG